ncbi:molybdopterin-dependent oxidoreductase [Chloroflexota bacterium]
MTQVSAGTEIKKSNCVWCKGECGVLVHVKDGRLIGVEPDPDYPRKVWPPTKGCVRRKAAVEYFYHPDRLNFPLKRVGEKGEGKWQRISWEQALDEIADKLKEIINKHGAEAVCRSTGTGPRSDIPTSDRFFNIIGAPNICSQGQICFRPRIIAGCITVGYHPEMHGLGPKTKCMVFLGVEPLIARPPISNKFWAAKRNGAKLIVIDPRYTRSASLADTWLQLRPGTDCAVLMGMINVIIKEDLYDKEFVDKWCHGFDKLRERAEEYTPEKVEAISEVPAETIREAARVYAQNRPGCFVEGMGVEHLPNNAEALHARWILAGLTGNIDVEGGEQLAGPSPQFSPEALLPKVVMPQEQLDKQIGADRFKLFSWKGNKIIADNSEKTWGRRLNWVNMSQGSLTYRAMITGEPYPVRAMITFSSNPMITQANTKLVYKALKSLDLYVVMDFFMTPSAALADYVLPAACWLEVPWVFDKLGVHPGTWFSEAAVPDTVPGEYEHKDDYDVWRGLAIRLGKGDLYPWKSHEEYYNDFCKPSGMTHKELVHKVRYAFKNSGFKKYEKTGFATPTGKVEFYSTIFEQLGYDPLPKFEEPAETPVSDPELTKEYPLMLITGGRMREYYHSEWRQIESVRKRRPDPTMQIHPDTAAKLGISNGDWVWIETIRGKVRQKAQLFDGLKPGVVHAEHGWWFPELPGEEPWLHGVWESNINVLMNDDPDVCSQINGCWPLKTALCKVYKVKSY